MNAHIDHHINQHAMVNIRQTLVDNTKILCSIHWKERHKILKGIIIKKKKYTLNKTSFIKEDSILKCERHKLFI